MKAKNVALAGLALAILARSPEARAGVFCEFAAPCYAPGFVGGKLLPGSGAPPAGLARVQAKLGRYPDAFAALLAAARAAD